MRFTTLSLALLALTGQMASAQESALTPEQAARMEQLDTEIATLTGERDELKAIEEAALPPKPWKGDLEFGYVDSSGNTEETNVTGKANATWEQDAWRFTMIADALNSESDGERTAEKYFYSNRLGYAFNEYDYIYGYLSYDDDRFSGFDYQTTASIGYGRRIYHTDTFEWNIEVGPGYRYSKYDEGSEEDDSEELIGRLATDLSWQISETTSFLQTLSTESGEENTISKSVTALKTQLIGAFSLKLSYTIKYTEEVPEETKHADTETAITLAYSF